MDLNISSKVNEALLLLKEREALKAICLEAFLQGDIAKNLADTLTDATGHLEDQPQLIYILLGNILELYIGNEISTITRNLGSILQSLSDQEVKEFVKFELFFRRDADNKLAKLTFQLLQKATKISRG